MFEYYIIYWKVSDKADLLKRQNRGLSILLLKFLTIILVCLDADDRSVVLEDGVRLAKAWDGLVIFRPSDFLVGKSILSAQLLGALDDLRGEEFEAKFIEAVGAWDLSLV